MKANVHIQHVAAVPGYEKIYIEFIKPTTGLERLITSTFTKPQYVAGKEPKYSLYIGSPEPQFIEGNVARQWTPSYKRFSWQRFWQALKAQNPAYTLECRCGVLNKNAKSYSHHKKHCAVMKEFKVFLNRIETSQIYQEYVNAERKSKRKKKVSKTDIKQRTKRRTKTIEAPKEKVAKRRTRKH
jgi:hypothetical protein